MLNNFKKLILLFLVYICFTGFSYSSIPRYNSFVGKNVIIITISDIYRGRISNIFSMDICQNKDGFGICITKVYYHTIVLETKQGKIFVTEDSVQEIGEIDG